MKHFLIIFCLLAYGRADTDDIYFEETKGTRIGRSYEIYTLMNYYMKSIIIDGMSQFTLDMENAISETRHKPSENIIFSPLCLTANLGMTFLASKGKTRAEIAQIFNVQSFISDPRFNWRFFPTLAKLIGMVQAHSNTTEIELANAIFIQGGPLNTNLQEIYGRIFKSKITEVDFSGNSEEAKTIINTWVKERTRGKIPKMLADPPSAGTEIILATALYFSGKWKFPFKTERTKKANFEIESNKVVEVDMMSNEDYFLYNENQNLGVEIVGLPYEDSKVTMYILLPHQSGVKALKDLKQKLSPTIINSLISGMGERKCQINFPKMNLSSTLRLRNEFESLGLKTLFRSDSELYFRSDYYSTNYVDNILHKVEIEIDESGTVAAAATFTIGHRYFDTPKQLSFNRPFLFFLKHDISNLILFWGTVNDPTQHN